jgi:hypothetical protein
MLRESSAAKLDEAMTSLGRAIRFRPQRRGNRKPRGERPVRQWWIERE